MFNLVVLIALGALVGCSGQDTSSSGAATKAAGGSGSDALPGAGNAAATAQAVLDRLLAAYKGAKSYQDAATVRLTIKHPQGDQNEEANAAVAFSRPNLLRYTREGVEVVSDGKQIFGKPDGWGGQVVVSEAPQQIRVPAFYNIAALQDLLQPDLTGNAIQLDLLTADKPLENVRDEDPNPELLAAEQLEGRNCDRISFRTDAGKLTLWIDQETSVLRRVEFPTDELKQALAPQGVQDVSLVAEFSGGQLDPPIDQQVFDWKTSADEILVRRLVPPPDPRFQPHPTLGNVVQAFDVTTQDGERQKSTNWNGKVTVLDFWATWCPYCIQGMPNFDKARQRFADNDDVRFVALSVDTDEISDEAIGAALAQTGSKVAWARAVESNPYEAIQQRFGLPGIPACVILDAKGRVQYHHVGADLDTETELPEKIEQVLEGKDPAADETKIWEKLQSEYQKQIEEARIASNVQDIPIGRVDVQPRSQPSSFKLNDLWRNQDLVAVGNLLVVPSEKDEPQIFALEGYRNVVQLDTAGKVVAKHQDIAPEKSIITFLRTAQDSDGGRIFIAGGLAQPHFYVYDDAWQVKLTHPDGDAAAVYDVIPADLDGDGKIELCVGYFREAGLHAVTLDGQRLWRNRSINNVADLAATSPDQQGHRRVLCAHSFGSLVPFDYLGERLKPIELVNRAITHVITADLDGDGQTEIAARATDAAGQHMAIGISEEGQLLWEHPLPQGEHAAPVEVVIAAKLFADQPARWLFAAADGSIHVISADGRLEDHFYSGQALTGLAVAQIDGRGVLLLADNQGISALAVSQQPVEQ